MFIIFAIVGPIYAVYNIENAKQEVDTDLFCAFPQGADSSTLPSDCNKASGLQERVQAAATVLRLS
jgi:hypothetical protein